MHIYIIYITISFMHRDVFLLPNRFWCLLSLWDLANNCIVFTFLTKSISSHTAKILSQRVLTSFSWVAWFKHVLFARQRLFFPLFSLQRLLAIFIEYFPVKWIPLRPKQMFHSVQHLCHIRIPYIFHHLLRVMVNSFDP